MSTREELKSAAFAVGQLLAEGAGDFYDVAEELANGYVAGVGAVAGSEHWHKTMISALSELASVVGNSLTVVVDEARDASVSWSVIGDGLDVSRQAAQQKYGKTAE